MLEVGKLYSCSGYFLLLYLDKETASAGTAAAESTEPHLAVVAYWSKRLKKPVSYSEPKTPLLVLSVDKKYVEVLAGDRKGWIINEGWLEIKEITDAAA